MENRCQWCGANDYDSIREDGFCDRCPEELKIKYEVQKDGE